MCAWGGEDKIGNYVFFFFIEPLFKIKFSFWRLLGNGQFNSLVFSCRVAGMPDFVAMSPPLFVKRSAIMLTKLFLFKFYFCMMMVLFVPSWNTLQIFHFILANKIFNFWIGPFKSIANYWATRQWDMLEFACITPSFQFYLHFNAVRWSNLQIFLFEHLL